MLEEMVAIEDLAYRGKYKQISLNCNYNDKAYGIMIENLIGRPAK